MDPVVLNNQSVTNHPFKGLYGTDVQKLVNGSSRHTLQFRSLKSVKSHIVIESKGGTRPGTPVGFHSVTTEEKRSRKDTYTCRNPFTCRII